MGMRQNIALQYQGGEKIYLYSHWEGDEGMSPLKTKLKAALQKRKRWDDESYLARIIISQVLKDDIDGETGYGISLEETDPEYPTIEVDLVGQTVDGISYEEFIAE